jgi:hypothetical protein
MVREMAATMQAAAKNAQASTKIGEGMLKKGKTLDLTENIEGPSPIVSDHEQM